jgi:hypothetical protein
MKFKTSYLKLFSILLVCFYVGCGEKTPEVKPVPDLTVYHDQKFTFEVSHPSNWISVGMIGNARFISSESGIMNFTDPFTATPSTDARIQVTTYETSESVAEIVKAYKDTCIAEQKIVEGEEDVELEGEAGKKVTVAANYGKDRKIKYQSYFFVKNGLAHIIELAAFNKGYEEWANVFDAVWKSVKFGVVPGSTTAMAAAEKPSDVFETYSTAYFTVQYPDNFNFSSPNKGKNDLSVELKGLRLDCTIRFDVFGAQNLTVDKVVEQNKGNYSKYKGSAPVKTTIDGNAGYYINYTPQANASSRAYFVVKNDKVIRLTLNWFTPESDTYKPVFEKVVSSIKLK